MKKIDKEFPDLITMSSIGETYLKNQIPLIELNNVNATNSGKKAIMITGAHHSRELTSISMSLYLMLKLCYGYKTNDTETMQILNSTIFYFIPVVNVDGFKYISDSFKENGGVLKFIRKNRNDGQLHGY